MRISDKVDGYYQDYYADGRVGLKRAIAARQTVAHLLTLTPLASRPYSSIIDVGAGDGAVLAEMEAQGVASELHAVEISESGCDAIRSRCLRTLRSVQRFDGYKIEAPNNRFALGIAVHVLEHVEHERAFLTELGRVSEAAYVEVPLELTARPERAVRIGAPHGHINFYNPQTFQNILRSSGLEILSFEIFANSREYEVFVGGLIRGTVKHLIRASLLKTVPGIAPYVMAYVAAAVCRRIPSGGA
jgi:ubiquinone/menaquinone biosynthesis C-methylase UbiE